MFRHASFCVTLYRNRLRALLVLRCSSTRSGASAVTITSPSDEPISRSISPLLSKSTNTKETDATASALLTDVLLADRDIVRASVAVRCVRAFGQAHELAQPGEWPGL